VTGIRSALQINRNFNKLKKKTEKTEIPVDI
jgi:hypothetical protein